MTPKLMTIGSLFSGIGGLELGLERGLNEACIQTEVRWQCEIEDFPRRVLAKHWPNTRRYRDVRAMGREEKIESVDLICGGFPCQDASGARTIGGHKIRGLDGERTGLWSEFSRIIGIVRPRYVVLENVARFPANFGGRDLGRVLGALAAYGYDAEWGIVKASASVGAPHQRARWLLLAYPNGAGAQGQVSAGGAGQAGPWGWRGEEDLRAIADRPFRRGARWPKPLIRRVDDGVPNRVERLRAAGNAVVPQVAAILGRRIAELESA